MKPTPAYRDTCPNNHPYSADNTQIDSRGYRRCLTCRRGKLDRREQAVKITRREYISPQPTAWMADAACLGIDPEMFQPDNWEDAKAAIRVCMGCSVILQCRVEAKAQGAGTAGVWAGKWYQEKANR